MKFVFVFLCDLRLRTICENFEALRLALASGCSSERRTHNQHLLISPLGRPDMIGRAYFQRSRWRSMQTGAGAV